MDYVNVAGLRIGFRRRGAGTPLVLLHGAVCDSRVWRVELECARLRRFSGPPTRLPNG